MKIAICGGGPLAVEMFFELNHLGAQVMLFASNPPGGMIRRMASFIPDLSMERPFEEITSELGRKIVNKSSLRSIPTVTGYWEEYLSLLIEKIPASSWKNTKVLRVQKRFLQLEEEIPGKTRLFDLFRLFYLVNSTKDMSFPQNTSPAVLESLQRSFEGFMDFDLVIDARGTAHCPKPVGGDGFALNEQSFFDTEDVIYGLHSAKKLEKILKDVKKIILAGSSATAALWVLKLASWMDENHQLIVISSNPEPFFTDKDIPQNLKERLDRLVEQKKKGFSLQYHKYESLFEDFKKLDDHVKIKTSPPKQPVCPIAIVGGSNVTAIDRLSDRKGIFVTVETAEFRTGNDKLQTLHADCLIVAMGNRQDIDFAGGLQTCYKFTAKNKSGRHPEPGFYTLGIASDLSRGIEQIKHIREDILGYFEKR